MKVAPSILSANWMFLAQSIELLENAGADWIHVDVMDGHFVSDLTFGPKMVADLRKITKLPLDVHLMVDKPEHWIEPFASAGADHIYIHAELANKDIKYLLSEIRQLGCKSGLALNPDSSTDLLTPYLELIDNVLIMSVNPGKAGQTFMPSVLPKITHLAGKVAEIVVDGGINHTQAQHVSNAGATTVVSGSYIFSHEDPRHAVSLLKNS